MARLALAAAGAVVGSFFGVPQVGWLVGSALGAVLFPESGPDTTTEGPRLGDLTVSSSAYGAAIPRAYGTIRMSGNMIWSTGIQEVKNVEKQSQGGKGGGGATQTTITYEYFATFCMAYAAGPADDVLRLWFDGKLVYDKTGTADDITKIDLFFRFYPGDEVQTPDSLILADKGEAATPAHRGLCNIVFENLALKDFGNRIPNITAEITFNGSADRNETITDEYTSGEGGVSTGTFQTDEFLPDFDRGIWYGVNQSATQGENHLRRFNMRNMVEDRQSTISTDALGNVVEFLSLHAIMPDGYIVSTTDTGNAQPISVIDPNSLQPVATFGISDNDTSNSPTQFVAPTVGRSSWVETGGGNYFFLSVNGLTFKTFGLLETTGGIASYLWDSDTFDYTISEDRVKGSCAGAVGETFGEAYIAFGPQYNVSSTGSVRIAKITVDDGAFYDADSGVFTGVAIEDVVTLTTSDMIEGETSIADFVGPIYDQIDDTIMFQAQADSDNSVWMVKIDPSDGSVLWRTQFPSSSPSIAIKNGLQGFASGRNTNGVFAQMGGTSGQSSIALRTTDGEIFETIDGGWTNGFTSSGASWWDGKTNTFIGYSAGTGAVIKWSFFRGSGQGDSLQDIITDICTQTGLAASDLDFTGLTATTVQGYTISRQGTARSALEQLSSVFFFDGVESDHLLKFVSRDGKSTQATIAQNKLAIIDNETGEFFQEARIQEVEMPRRVTLTYIDKDNDYQQQAHSSQRILAPTSFQTSFSNNAVNLTLPIVMDSDTAKQATEKILISSWEERSSFSTRLPWEYIALDPTDLVTITLDSGTSFRLRLSQTDVGQDFALDVSAVSEDAAQYTSTVTADSGTGPLTQEFLSEVITKLLLVCSPLLRDSHDNGRSNLQLYSFMGGFGQPGWDAATLFKSSDNVIFDQVGSVIAEMTWGTCSTALGDTDTPYQTDTDNTVTVFLNTNTDTGLSSVTQLQMLNGSNAAAIIDSNNDVEIIAFRTATLNADGSYTLSNLLRGKRGTENFTGGHAAGSLFLLLEDATGDRIDLDLSELNTTRYYRPVTSGTLFEEASSTSKASPGRDLMPYRPVHLDKTSGTWTSTDIVLEWVRQTRIGGQGILDESDTVPLSEDSEEYVVEILTPGGTVARSSVTASENPTTNSFTYTTARQTTDDSAFWSGMQDETANLLTNPSFETSLTGEGSAIPGWTFVAGQDVCQVITGADGSITGAQNGSNYLDMSVFGSETAVELTQTVDLNVMADSIDSGSIDIRAGVYINEDSTDTDTGRIDIVWLDNNDSVLQTDSGTNTSPTTAGTWQQITVTGTAPFGARKVRVELHGTRNTGNNLNIAMDNVTLEVEETSKDYLHFRVYQVSAQVGNGFVSEVKSVEV